MKNALILSLIAVVSCASEKNEKFVNENPHLKTVSYFNTDTKGHLAYACVTTRKKDGAILNTLIEKNNLLWTSFDGRSQEQISSNIPFIMSAWLEKRYNETNQEQQK